jgi:hypothetical protein
MGDKQQYKHDALLASHTYTFELQSANKKFIIRGLLPFFQRVQKCDATMMI